MRKTAISILFILLIASFRADALDLLSLARTHDNLGWKLAWARGDARGAHLCFLKAIDSYRKYLDKTGISIRDIETRRFGPLDAQKRIVYIYKFGLKNQNLAKKEFQRLLDMYARVKAEFNINQIGIRIKSKISQLNAEFEYKGYVVQTNEDCLWCLFLGEFCADELIIYQDLVPIARAKIKEIKKINHKETIVRAQVFCKNPLIKVKTFCNVQPTTCIGKVEEGKAALAEKYYDTGKELFEKRDFEEAEEYFWYALRYKPYKKEALNMLGLIYFYYQDIDRAEELFIRALEIDPTYLEAFINLAGTYLGGSDFPIDTNKVLDMLEGAITINKNYTRAYYWLGHYYDDFMFFDLADKSYRQGDGGVAVLPVDNWYKQTSLKKKLNSAGQIYWDTANIYLDDYNPMLNSSIYVFDELLKLNPRDLNVKKRIDGILKVCPFARDSSLYKDVISCRKRGLELKKQNRLKEAIDEIRTSLYLDQVISSEFRRCIRRIPRIRID